MLSGESVDILDKAVNYALELSELVLVVAALRHHVGLVQEQHALPLRSEVEPFGCLAVLRGATTPNRRGERHEREAGPGGNETRDARLTQPGGP